MGSVNPTNISRSIPLQHRAELRVRFEETDAQGHVHHSKYLNYFEVARGEMFRAGGRSYREMEEQGYMLVVVKATCDYRSSARFDDLLVIDTKVVRSKGVRIVHHYEIRNGDDIVCVGETVLACVDRSGNVQPLPEWLRIKI
ncbi:acyl-CoA thioesterase [Mariniblastus fucicola]|uniref:Acyl-CoA thioester hydrolase YbgC n=1 Tax=Mariniblastus fucicola TaxID=980251 RepID=A0A5B9PCU7_9BACT|nr:thioesterase family protein [Mariniblastus fucicola]QEG22732.1 Acyl-CoA thioester hydrolase YbgC [Mariniblastus fucicola]